MPFFAWLMFRLTSHWKQFRISGSSRIGNDLPDRKSTRLNSSHLVISYAVFCLKKKRQVIVTKGAGTERFRAAIYAHVTKEPSAPDIACPDEYLGTYLAPRRGCCFFFFNDTATTEIYTLSLHDALPIYSGTIGFMPGQVYVGTAARGCPHIDRKSTRLNSSHLVISYAVFCLKKKTT